MAMLKVSTAATIVIGPMVDNTDGFTAETALTISQADIRLSKNGAAFAQTSNAAGATHMELGHYSVPLSATDTDTLGRLRVAISETGALPVWRDFEIVPANVWDSLFGADKLQVHADEITNGLITAAAIATGAIDADAIADNAIDAGAIAADAITAAKIADGAIDAATFAAGAINAAAIAADAIGASELAADAVAEIADAVWDEAIAGHAGAGSTGEALAAAGSAGDPWVTALPGAYGAGTAGNIVGNNLNATVSSRATQTSVDTIDDFLDTEVAAILADTNELQTDWANGGRLDNILDARASQTSVDDLPTNAELTTALDAIPTAIENADALLNRDMSTGTDSGSATVRTPRQALRLLRNKHGVAAGTLTVTKEDDTTTSWSAAVTTDSAADPIITVDPASA